MTKFLSRTEANEVICMHDNCYCIFFGARANIKIDKMPSNGKETTPPALPPSSPPPRLSLLTNRTTLLQAKVVAAKFMRRGDIKNYKRL